MFATRVTTDKLLRDSYIYGVYQYWKLCFMAIKRPFDGMVWEVTVIDGGKKKKRKV